jgi:hypothetical protein
MHGSAKHTKFWFEILKERTTRKTGVYGRIILICILEKYAVWSGFIWLRRKTTRGLL